MSGHRLGSFGGRRWSRRISDQHRLVYQVTGKGNAPALEVAQCKYHY